MALSSSSRRIFRLLSVAGVSGAAFAGVLFASSPAHAQGYVYYSRPAPPPPAYGYGPRPYYYQEAPYAFQLGVDLEGVVPLNPPSVNGGPAAIGGGAGFKVRAGEELRFPGVRFTPEVGYAYDHLWAADNFDNSYDWSMNRLFAGARLGFGRSIVPDPLRPYRLRLAPDGRRVRDRAERRPRVRRRRRARLPPHPALRAGRAPRVLADRAQHRHAPVDRPRRPHEPSLLVPACASGVR